MFMDHWKEGRLQKCLSQPIGHGRPMPVVSTQSSLKSSTLSAWSALESPFSAEFPPSLSALVLPLFLLNIFSPNFVGDFLVWFGFCAGDVLGFSSSRRGAGSA